MTVSRRCLRRVVFLLCAIGTASAMGVTPRAQDNPSAVLAQAIARLDARDLAGAEPLFARASDLGRTHGDRAVEARALRGLADLREQARQPAAAIPFWERARALFEASGDWNGLGDLLGNRALRAYDQQRFDEAERDWLAAIAAYEVTDNTAALARVTRNLTFLPRVTRDEAWRLTNAAVALAFRSGDAAVEGVTRHQLSDQLFNRGALAAAAVELQAALELLQAGGDSPQLGRAYTSAGRLSRAFGRIDEAVGIQERAASILERLGDTAGAAQALDAAVRAQFELPGDPELPVATAWRAVEMARRSGSLVQIVTTTCRLGVALARAGRAAEGLPLLDPFDLDTLTPGLRGAVLESRAAILARLGRHVEALASLDAHDGHGAADSVMNRVALRAWSLRALGRNGEAQDETRRAVAQLEALAEQLLPEDATKRRFFDRQQHLIDLHVRLLADLGQPAAALEAAERGRARAFLDLMSSRRLPALFPAAGTAPTSAARPAAAVRALPSSQIVPDASRRRQPAPPLTLEALAMRGGGPATPPALEEPFVASPAVGRAVTMADVTAAARAQGTHLLAYWTGDDETLVWVVSPDGAVTLARVEVGAARLSSLARAAAGTGAASREALRTLHRLLVAPVREALPSVTGAAVTVVPHGPLFRVSFAALQSAAGQYLVEDMRLNYVPSIGALLAVPRRDSTRGRAVVVADPLLEPDDVDRLNLPPLPAARAEAGTLGGLLRGRGVDVLVGRTATEARLRPLLPGAAVLHFATHGVVSDLAPWTSYLALGRDAASGAGTGDGRLTAAELYDLKLDASLVVLGACRTAIGPATGDGITGLVRGFFAAGVPSVVASLWDVPDVTTARMQPEFYRQWLTSGSPAAALRHAQLRLLDDLRAGRVTVDTEAGPLVVPEHPSVWAGLMLMGQP